MIRLSFVLAATVCIDASEQSTLRVGVPLAGSIPADAPSHPSPAGVLLRSSAPWPGVSFPLVVEQSIPYFLTLRSPDFDAYLVLTDADGKVIAEDDDGFIGTNARIEAAALTPGVIYSVSVLTPEGSGAFTLTLDSTLPTTPSTEEASPEVQADLYKLAKKRFDLGDYVEALPLYERALDVGVRVLGEDHPATAASASGLGSTQLRLGHFAEALPYLQRAVDVQLRVLGEDHADTADSLNALGAVLSRLGRVDEGLPLFQRVLDIRLRVLGENHVSTATSLQNLGVSLFHLGHPNEALPFFQRAFDVRLLILGEEHKDTLEALHNLASAHWTLGHYAEALPLRQRVLAIRLRVLGEHHLDTVAALDNVGDLEFRLLHHDEALTLFQRALDIQIRVLGEDHPDTARSLHNLGVRHLNLRRLDEALPYFQRALAIRLRFSGEDHPDTAETLNSLGHVQIDLHHDDEARALFQRAVDIRLRVLGDEHVDTAQSLNNLGSAHAALGRFDEALPLFERALAIRLRVLGEDHADTVASLDNLATVQLKRGRHVDALPFQRRALAICLRSYGEEHENTAIALSCLAETYRNLHDVDEASRLAQRALEIQLHRLGPADAATNLTIKLLVQVLTEAGDQSALETLLIDHHRRCVEAYGATDPRVAPSVARLAIFEWERGEFTAASARAEEALRIGGWESSVNDHGNENLLFAFGQILSMLGRLADARTFATYAVALSARFHDGERCSVHPRRSVLGEILIQLGSFADAENEYRLALEDCQSGHAEDDPETWEALFGLARAVQDQGRAADAEVHLRHLLAIGERVLPNDHESLQVVRLRLAESLRAQGKQVEADRVQETVTVATVYRPALLVSTPDRLETTTEQRTVDLDAVITDYSGVADVKIVRDGFALSIRALEDRAEQPGKYLTPDKTGQKATLHFPIAFRDGQERIELVVSAQNRRGQWSDPQTFRVTYQPPQRDLYLLALGVQDYDDDALDLKCPVADVDGIVAAMKDQEGGFYSKVHVKRLVDREVTSGEAKRCVDQFLVQAQPRDTIVVFAAGHGVRTEHSEYYFLTSNTTPADPYDGIDRATIESLVTSDKLHAQRRLLLLDTCHAGGNAPGTPASAGTRAGAIRTLVQQDEVNQFRAADESTGLYILASSTDDSFAREADGNGLFTRALLDGLAGEADTGALGDGNGLVEIEELKNYVYFQVLEASQGCQRATVPKVISGENFPIGRAKSGAPR